MAKVAQRQVLASIAPSTTGQTGLGTGGATKPPSFPSGFKFAQVSGGEITASVEKIYEGGKFRPTVLCAPAEIGDITLTAHYDDDSAAGGLATVIKSLRQFVGVGFYDVTIQNYNCGITSSAHDRLYKSALLVGLTEPDGDSSSGAPTTFALTFSISDIDVPATTPAAATTSS